MGKLQIFHCESLPIPPGTKSPVKGGTFFFAAERAARRRFWLILGAVLAALVVGILIGRFLLG
jgi:hypothetical protein